ncbi:MAG: hypothetical protein KBD37_03065 [Burkholderiales bacterium]|nr:hypothetical protein [Burkholderiales bacterium]
MQIIKLLNKEYWNIFDYKINKFITEKYRRKIKDSKRLRIIKSVETLTSQARLMPFTRYAGFNALELMLVLAVIAVGIGVALHTMSSNADKQDSNQMISDISALVSNIQNAYASSAGGYTDLTTATAIQAKLVPTDLRLSTDGSSVLNQFQSGTVDIAPSDDGSAFTITYSSVPSSVCNTAVAALAGSGFNVIEVEGTAVYDASGDAFSPGTLSEACDNPTNSIVFTAS